MSGTRLLTRRIAWEHAFGIRRDLKEFTEITDLGSNIRVELNGTIVMESHVPSAPAMFNGRPHLGRNRTSGAICFCGHTDPVQFRNVLIKELPGGL